MAELSTIARPYAEALFATAKGNQDALASWSGLVNELAAVASLDDVRDALTDPRINKGQRIELFTGLIKSPLSDAARNFIELLVQNGRILLLPEIAQQLQEAVTKANRLIGSVDKGYGDQSKFHRDLDRLIPQLTDAARSIRALSDLLTRHPEALIQGRTNTGKE